VFAAKKEAKRLEKEAKLAAKAAKAPAAAAAGEGKKAKAEKKEKEVEPEFVNTTPKGQKKGARCLQRHVSKYHAN
jgi:valyl-tRNA synthetase